MHTKRFSTLLIAGIFAATVLSSSAFAAEQPVRIEEVVDPTVRIVNEEDVCGFTAPENKTYGAQMISVRKKMRVEIGEKFRVKIFMKNTGTMPWFSNNSKCLGPKMSLGTDNPRDGASIFYNETNEGWESNNRIGMDQLRVEPGEIASFTFFAHAGDKAEAYKQYLTPVLKDVEWIESSRFSFEIVVGDLQDKAADLRKKMTYAHESGSVSVIDLNAKKSIVVDRSDQRAFAKLGEHVVREFPISSGAPKTPTPLGTTKIEMKQEVRIGAKPPHYIMPKYMWFRAGGYGFHALPSLGNDGGVFWTEARDHMGIPVSHGCVRLLPEDADWLYDFAEVGTEVTVQQ